MRHRFFNMAANRRLIFILALAIGLAGALPSAWAAVNQLLWRKESPLGTLGALSLRGDTDSTGSYYFGGATANLEDAGSNTGGRAFLRKQGPRGGILWTKKFGAGELSAILDVAVDKRKDWVYVVGTTSGGLPNQRHGGEADSVLRKYNRQGGILWTRQFGGSGDDAAVGVAVGPGGNVVVTGTTGASAGVEPDGFIREYRADGKLLGDRRFGTPGFDIGTDVAIDGSGQIFIAGATTGKFGGQSSAGDADAFLLKLDQARRTVWVRQFGRPSLDFITSVAVEPRGNIYVVGSVGERALAAKFAPGGKRLWTRLLSDQIALGAAVDSGRNLYVVGAKMPADPSESPRAFVRKYTTTGTRLWTRNVALGLATGVAVNGQNELFVSGFTIAGLENFTFTEAPTEPLTNVFVVKFADLP